MLAGEGLGQLARALAVPFFKSMPEQLRGLNGRREGRGFREASPRGDRWR